MGNKLDQEAYQRRVAPIYDAIDARNWKLAIKLCNAAITKHPNSHYLKTLKAVSLARSGKHDEAWEVCQDVLGSGTWDESALHTLALALKPLGKLQALTAAYELSVGKHPASLELLRGLFQCHIRSLDFVKQQQVALKLSKQSGDAGYTWWVVLALVLQAGASARGRPGMMGSSQALALAQGLVERLLKGGSPLGSQEELLLYLDVLQAQGKHQQALELLDSAAGDLFSIDSDRQAVRSGLLLVLGRLQEAAGIAKAALAADPDNFGQAMLLLDCLLPSTAAARCHVHSLIPCVSGGPGNVPERLKGMQLQGPDDVQQAAQAVQAVREAARGTGTPSRGAELAAVELAYRHVLLAQQQEQQQEQQQLLAEAMLGYVASFGHLLSCAIDLRVYSRRLGGTARAWLVEQLHAAEAQRQQGAGAAAAAAAAGDKEQVQRLRRYVCMEQVKFDMGMPAFEGPGAAVQHAQQLMRRYSSARPLYAGLDERERGPADELVVLAASALVRAYLAVPQGAVHLLQALLVLLAGVQARPYSAPMRLALCALYGLLGCPVAAAGQMRKLDIKNIQLDSLSSHHLLPLLVALGAADDAGALLSGTLHLFDEHAQDVGDSLMAAYNAGTYTKVPEFVAFTERLRCSHTLTAARTELLLLNVSRAAEGHAAAAAAPSSSSSSPLAVLQGGLPKLASWPAGDSLWAEMRFNQDLATRPAWLPPPRDPFPAAVASWWEDARQQASGSSGSSGSGSGSGTELGTGRAWWNEVAAAEGRSVQAAAFRDAWCRSARRRLLLPHCWHAVLDDVDAAGTAVQQQRLEELLAELACLYGTQPQQLQQHIAGSLARQAELPTTELVQLLPLALLALGQRVQQLLAGSSTAAEPAAQLGHLVARLAAAVQLRLVQQLQQAATASGLLAHSGWSSALPVMTEDTLLAQLLADKLQQHRKASKKKKGKSGSSADAEDGLRREAAAAAAGQAVAAAAGPMRELAAALKAAAEQVLSATPAADVAAEQLLQQAGSAEGAELWGWEVQMNAATELKQLLSGQQATLKRLQALASKRCSGIAAAMAGLV